MQIGYQTRIIIELLMSAFLAILFLQSGLDKVLDWAGNKSYIASVFEKTPLKRFSTFLLFCVTCTEILAGLLCAAGLLAILLSRDRTLAFMGACLSSVNIVNLFLGQRIAKDYAGAAGLVPYFLTTIVAVAMLSP